MSNSGMEPSAWKLSQQSHLVRKNLDLLTILHTLSVFISSYVPERPVVLRYVYLIRIIKLYYTTLARSLLDIDRFPKVKRPVQS